ncbi:hypothetical protein H4S07_001166 [Coemansia furcata]|uniref:Uncharacterized protein n=1 Tax=Coemansia furcata TaxID=417177 RepID=A0ACC1LNP1_9FUNG|nr:hypothetical protein H4S07_001166 [Coemansia furcata]
MRVQESYSEYPVRAVIVMGVSGSGKSTIGQDLAQRLGQAPFIDADSLHPATNVAKMAEGVPLADKDRWPWLQRVREEISKQAQGLLAGRDSTLRSARTIVGNNRESAGSQRMYVVCACSSLKRSYREFLSRSDPDTPLEMVTHDTVFVYVDVSKKELLRRLDKRENHFFNPRLLDSQLETLEPPDTTRESAINVYGEGTAESVVEDVYQRVTRYIAKNSL